jgi:hypothetical protein
MHSKSAALVIIVPSLRVMVMQSHNSGWSIKASLKCKLHVPISDIYCICILVSHDLLVLSKHAKHGHSSSPLSCFLFLIYLCFFFVFVSSLLLLFLSSAIVGFLPFFFATFLPTCFWMALISDALSYLPITAFDRCDKICTWISVNSILGLYIWRSWPQRWFLLWCCSRYLSPL